MKLAAIIVLLMLSYVSSPAHVPNFDNFHTPVLEPGEVGQFNFTIQNRYVAPMSQCRLNVSIYMWATENEAKSIWEIENRPVIKESGDVNYSMMLGTIQPGKNATVFFHIRSFEHTPDGVYFVRFSLSFIYNGTLYKMWSPGNFPKDVWNNATQNHTLDLDYLASYLNDRVDGIIPDSSFSVKTDLTWVLYILIGITTVVGIMALYSYLHEEGLIGRKEEKIYQLKGKYRVLKRIK
jgi:hypothetical protein